MRTAEAAYPSLREKRAVLGWLLLLATATALLVTGCGALAEGPPALEEQERQPFSARRESEDGAIVAWSGYVDGYEPGMEASFDITIKNGTDEAWPGRFCVQLMDDEQPQVLATLEQRPFKLEPSTGFSDTVTVELPEALDEGPYGLSLVAWGPNGSSVDQVPIKVGETDKEPQPATQRDVDAALEACPDVTGAKWGVENVVALAKESLVEHAGVSVDEIVVEDVKEVEFPDASLGVPEPDRVYAQVITPGYVIRLKARGEVYEYHGAGKRVVLAVEGAEDASKQ